MRFVTTFSALLAFSLLAGCATSSGVSRHGDTAVRAESRRISATPNYENSFHDGPEIGSRGAHTL